VFYRSGRVFKLWDYSVSHKQMLLRSPRTPDIKTNIDVVFWGVEFIEIATVLAGIEITAGTADHAVLAARLHDSIGTCDVYRIVSVGKRYLAVAQGFQVLENVLDIFESTLVNFSADRPIEEYGVVLAHS